MHSYTWMERAELEPTSEIFGTWQSGYYIIPIFFFSSFLSEPQSLLCSVGSSPGFDQLCATYSGNKESEGNGCWEPHCPRPLPWVPSFSYLLVKVWEVLEEGWDRRLDRVNKKHMCCNSTVWGCCDRVIEDMAGYSRGPPMTSRDLPLHLSIADHRQWDGKQLRSTQGDRGGLAKVVIKESTLHPLLFPLLQTQGGKESRRASLYLQSHVNYGR